MVEGKRRARCSREEWKRRVAAWRGSGLSAAEFCRRRDLACSTLRWWAWRLPEAGSPAETAGLVRVEAGSEEAGVEGSRRAEPFEVLLSGGIVVRVFPSFEAVSLRRLIACLGGEPLC